MTNSISKNSKFEEFDTLFSLLPTLQDLFPKIQKIELKSGSHSLGALTIDQLIGKAFSDAAIGGSFGNYDLKDSNHAKLPIFRGVDAAATRFLFIQLSARDTKYESFSNTISTFNLILYQSTETLEPAVWSYKANSRLLTGRISGIIDTTLADKINFLFNKEQLHVFIKEDLRHDWWIKRPLLCIFLPCVYTLCYDECCPFTPNQHETKFTLRHKSSISYFDMPLLVGINHQDNLDFETRIVDMTK